MVVCQRSHRHIRKRLLLYQAIILGARYCVPNKFDPSFSDHINFTLGRLLCAQR
jgi:hypothetical protein